MKFSKLRLMGFALMTSLIVSCGSSDNKQPMMPKEDNNVQPISIQSVWDMSRFNPTTHVYAIAECKPMADYPNEPTVRLIRMSTDGSPVDATHGMMRIWYIPPDKSQEDRVVGYGSDAGFGTYVDTMMDSKPMIRWSFGSGETQTVLFGWDGMTFTYLGDCMISGRHMCTIIKQQMQ